jgi:hypothetical protein
LTVYSISVVGQKEADTADSQKVVFNRSLRLLTGISAGRRLFADIGLSRNTSSAIGHHHFSSAWFISTEFSPGNRFIIGPKIGTWTAGGVGAMALGLNMIYYTDFDKGSLVFRPEIGFGLDNVKVVYGYNAILTKDKLEGINKHLGSIVYCHQLKRLKDKITKF